MRFGHLLISAFLVACLVHPLAPVVQSVHAAEVRDLYEATVPVGGKSAAERGRALSVALEQVFSKVSGRRNPRAVGTLSRAFGQPQRLTQQFRYTVAPRGESASKKLRLWAKFDQGAIKRLLSEAGLPVWGQTRPAVLAWVAVESEGTRFLLGVDDTDGLAQAMQNGAGRRGLPLRLPLMDVDDRARVSVTDVWGGFKDTILAASERYGAEAVLVGRVYRPAGGAWEARWQMYLKNDAPLWQTRGSELEGALVEGVHKATNLLAVRFAAPVGVSRASGLTLEVSGIRSLEDYARTLRYLASLQPVRAVQPLRVEGDWFSFSVDAHGGSTALHRVIGLGSTLAAEGLSSDPQQPLRFRLGP